MSYSPNVAYLACWGVGGCGSGEGFFFSYFPPLKPRQALWSSASYGLKNMVHGYFFSYSSGGALDTRGRDDFFILFEFPASS